MILRILLALTLGAVLGGQANRFGGWLPDLLSHFYLQYFWILGVLGVLAMFFERQGRKTNAALCILGLGLCAGILWKQTIRVTPPLSADKKTIKIILANVNSQNRNFDSLLQWIKEKDPDLFGLIELNDDWEMALQPLKKNYAHIGAFPQVGAFGLGVFSRLRLIEKDIQFYGATGVPSVEVKVAVENKQFLILLTHPYPPVFPALYHLRNNQLEEVGEALTRYPGPKILMGDLNATPFSNIFKTLIVQLDFRDSRRGFGFQATWPSLFGPMGIPIDHILVSKDFQVVDREVGPHIGSDHRPVYLELILH